MGNPDSYEAFLASIGTFIHVDEQKRLMAKWRSD